MSIYLIFWDYKLKSRWVILFNHTLNNWSIISHLFELFYVGTPFKFIKRTTISTKFRWPLYEVQIVVVLVLVNGRHIRLQTHKAAQSIVSTLLSEIYLNENGVAVAICYHIYLQAIHQKLKEKILIGPKHSSSVGRVGGCRV